MSKAVKKISTLYKKHKTWRNVAKVLGVNKGVVYSVANGKIAPTPQICKALGLPVERHATAPVCAKCGALHITKRCTRKPSFEELSDKYAAWKNRFSERLQTIIVWAEQKAPTL